MRTMFATLVAAGVLLLGAAPASPPELPVNFISVDELKKLLDSGTRADIIDVRHWDAYAEMHIKGARSMPVRAVEQRSTEICKTGLVGLLLNLSACAGPGGQQHPVRDGLAEPPRPR